MLELNNSDRPPRVGSLFSGYGGLDLAVEHALDAETIWFSENNEQVGRIFAHYWPDAPQHGRHHHHQLERRTAGRCALRRIPLSRRIHRRQTSRARPRHPARRRNGPVAIFDPQHLAEGLPAGMRWSRIRGCESPQTAMIRATGLAAGTGLSSGGVDGGGFWEGKTRTALQALLHAAALDNRPPSELFRWTLDPTAAADAVAILTNSPQAATGWAESLEAMIDSDPRTRDSIWQGVSLALGSLADPRVLDAVSPGPGESFDPETFIQQRGTLFLLATGSGTPVRPGWPMPACPCSTGRGTRGGPRLNMTKPR